jgi:4-hydroxy-tetrahydrodipicolinate reductase
MKIGIIGYGKMGREIEKIARERNHEVELIIDLNNMVELASDALEKIDVAFEFTQPDSAYSNIMKCFESNTAVVCGTTGWLSKFEEVKNHCVKNHKTFFYAPNYSIGVNILFAINRQLAKIMNRFTDYEVEIEEIHHVQKLDKPSGTAITLANDIISNIDRKVKWEKELKKQDEDIPIRSVRKDMVTGTHTIIYDSYVDKLEIKHEAKSRKGFALGAIFAAEFLKTKTGFYGMNDLLGLY